MILKMEKKRQTDEAYIKDLLKSTGYLFPETDEQMSIYEANVTLRELPEKFRTPEFVFNAVQNQRSSNIVPTWIKQSSPDISSIHAT